jgi:hypothetical protein
VEVGAIVVRPLMPEDADAVHTTVANAFRGTSYLGRIQETLESALRFDDPEYLCLLAAYPDDGVPSGLVLFGTVLGARLATKVHSVVAVDPRVQIALLDAVRETCVRSGERLVVCELPQDSPFDVTAVALIASGFREEGRIADFVRDGVALRLLVWRPDAADVESN